MLNERSYTVVATVAALFSISMFPIGTLIWQHDQYYNPVQGSHLYFLCYFSGAYTAFLSLFIVARTKFLKVVSSTGCSIFAISVYEELMYRDRAWTRFHYALIILVAVNYFIFYCIIDKLKKK